MESVEITSKRAELLKGFVRRKTHTEITIQLRVGNQRTVRMNEKFKKFRLGQRVLIGWDYERAKIHDMWTEDEISHPEDRDVPEELLGMIDETTYKRWVNVPV